ncbi:dystrotelin [Pelodytes ibericus]
MTEYPTEDLSLPETVPLQALQFIKEELLRTQKSIKDLQSERRLLRKQLSRWTGAVQVLQESQEDSCCRLEAKIQALNETSECMRTELQQLRQNVQNHDEKAVDFPSDNKQQMAWQTESKEKATVPSTKTKAIRQNSKLKRGLNVKNLQNYGKWTVNHCPQVENQNNHHSSKFPFQRENDCLKAQNRQTLTHMRHLCESLKAGKSFSGQVRYGGKCCPSSDQPKSFYSISDEDANTCFSLIEPHPVVSRMKNEGAELQELVENLKDALSIQIQPGHLPGIKEELLQAAEHVCKSYSEFINKTIEPTLK